MNRYCVYALSLGALLAACQAGPQASTADGRSNARDAVDRPAPKGGLGGGAPSGTTAPPKEGGTSGPHEGSRGSTPPGATRDGLPPVGGAIVDPAGAVTKDPPPAGMR